MSSRPRPPCSAGAVHLNLMFREPLSPAVVPFPRAPLETPRVKAWLRSARPFTQCARTTAAPPSPLPPPPPTPPPQHHHHHNTNTNNRYIHPRAAPSAPATDPSLRPVARRLRTARRGVLLAGPCNDAPTRLAVAACSAALGWPLLADACSGLRSPHISAQLGEPTARLAPLCDLLLTHKALAAALRPDVVVQIGGRLTSKRLVALGASATTGDPSPPRYPRRTLPPPHP